jgi:hypothetical protein
MLQNCHLIAGMRISSFPGNAKIGSKAHRLTEILQWEKNAFLFEQLYRVEKASAGRKPEKGETQADRIRRFRKQQRPVLNALKIWLDDMVPKVLPDSKLGDAVTYTRKQWDYLTRYTEDGRMPIDNNLLESDIRLFATGRKAWLFSDSVEGRQGQRRRLQPDADLPRLACRAISMVCPCSPNSLSSRSMQRSPTCSPSTSTKPPLPGRCCALSDTSA